MPAADRVQLFDALYDAHRTALHAYLLARCGDPDTAQDLLQELFLRAWRSLGSIGALPPERRQYWLFSVARNLVVDHYRGRGVRDAAQQRLEMDSPPRLADAAESDAIQADQLRRLDAAIWRLPTELREVLVLNVLGERTSADIGELLGRPAGTVRYQLAQARRRLAADLGLEEDESA